MPKDIYSMNIYYHVLLFRHFRIVKILFNLLLSDFGYILLSDLTNIFAYMNYYNYLPYYL